MINNECVLQSSGDKSSHQDKSKKNTPRHILMKLSKIKYKENILKAAREKKTNNTQGNPHKVNS